MIILVGLPTNVYVHPENAVGQCSKFFFNFYFECLLVFHRCKYYKNVVFQTQWDLLKLLVVGQLQLVNILGRLVIQSGGELKPFLTCYYS